MQGTRLAVGPLLDGGCVRLPWGAADGLQWVGSDARNFPRLNLSSVGYLFFFRADDRCERGMAPLQVEWRVAWPPMASQDGTATAQHPMLHS
jgi:hypothetical protein